VLHEAICGVCAFNNTSPDRTIAREHERQAYAFPFHSVEPFGNAVKVKQRPSECNGVPVIICVGHSKDYDYLSHIAMVLPALYVAIAFPELHTHALFTNRHQSAAKSTTRFEVNFGVPHSACVR